MSFRTLRYFLALLPAIAICHEALSQDVKSQPRIDATISADSVMIGDRFTLSIDVEHDVMQVIAFPSFDFSSTSVDSGTAEGVTDNKDAERASATPRPNIECLQDHPVDTIRRSGRLLHLRKRYTMAAFDEGIYSLGRPKVLCIDKNRVDTLEAANNVEVVVATFLIDSTAKGVLDFKPQKHLPFRFGEISGYLTAALIVAAIIALAIWVLARHLAKRGKSLADLFRPEPPLPPHIVAISALEALHNRKLWQNNMHKEYYSSLSEILRTYLDGQFGVGAMEMTTDEIIEAIKPIALPQKSAMDLVSLLRDADLVKFAKALPEASENEEAYAKAYYFVEETKPVEESDEDADEESAEAILSTTKNENRDERA